MQISLDIVPLRSYRLTLIGGDMSVALTLHMQIRTGSLKLGLAADDGGVDAKYVLMEFPMV